MKKGMSVSTGITDDNYRKEKISLLWSMNGVTEEQVKKIRGNKDLGCDNVRAGDSVTIDYSVSIEYFGNVAKKLSLLIELGGEPNFNKAELAMLEGDVCLIQEVLKKIK